MAENNGVLSSFSERLKCIRKSLGISQEELAYRAGLHRTYIGMLERAERNLTLNNLIKISKALDVETCLLIHNICTNSHSFFEKNFCVNKKAKDINCTFFNNGNGYCENACINNNLAFRILVEECGDIIYVLDKRGIIVFENSSVSTILGYNPSERIGNRFADYIHKDELSKFNKKLNSFLKKVKQKESIELRLKHNNGSWV